MFNQLTGGSNTTVSTYTPIRVAAAIAKGALLEAAAIELGSVVALLKSKDGVITAPDGSSATYGELAEKAASPTTKKVDVQLKGRELLRGHRHARRTGSTRTTSSPGRRSSRWTSRSPTRCRRWSAGRPRSTARPKTLRNEAAVLAMPGVTDVALIATGIAVRAADLRPVHRRDPCDGRRLEPGHRRGRVRRHHPRQGAQGRAAARRPQGARRWPRRSRPTSPSCSAAAPRSSPTPPSPTCAPTTPRSGPA